MACTSGHSGPPGVREGINFTSPGLQVVAIDMRGYGESDRPKDRRAYDLSELTADVSEVIKALGHQEYAPLSSELRNTGIACQQVWVAARGSAHSIMPASRPVLH